MTREGGEINNTPTIKIKEEILNEYIFQNITDVPK